MHRISSYVPFLYHLEPLPQFVWKVFPAGWRKDTLQNQFAIRFFCVQSKICPKPTNQERRHSLGATETRKALWLNSQSKVFWEMECYFVDQINSNLYHLPPSGWSIAYFEWYSQISGFYQMPDPASDRLRPPGAPLSFDGGFGVSGLLRQKPPSLPCACWGSVEKGGPHSPSASWVGNCGGLRDPLSWKAPWALGLLGTCLQCV